MFTQNPDFLYVQKVKIICSEIDATVKKFITDNNLIEKHRIDADKKTNRFKGIKTLILFLAVAIVLLMPFSLFAFFTDIPVWHWLPFFALIITFIIRLYFQKKIAPIHNDACNKIISTTQESLMLTTAELNEYKEIYEHETQRVPDDLRHEFVLDILSEAIRQGYVDSLQDAVEFYREHLDVIEHDDSEAAMHIQKEILDSEKSVTERVKIFSLL